MVRSGFGFSRGRHVLRTRLLILWYKLEYYLPGAVTLGFKAADFEFPLAMLGPQLCSSLPNSQNGNKRTLDKS
jgi:hypothetical protein